MGTDTIATKAVDFLIKAGASKQIIDGLGRYCSDLAVENHKLTDANTALRQKIALLTAQNSTLEKENAVLRGENKALKEQKEAADLSGILADKVLCRILKELFNADYGINQDALAEKLGLKMNEFRLHEKTLIDAGLIRCAKFGIGRSLTDSGRKLVKDNGL